MSARSFSSGFSLLHIMGRITGGTRGMQFGPSYRPRPIAAALPTPDHTAIKARLTPVLAALEHDRTAHAQKTERQLRLAVAGAGLAGLALGWSMFGSLIGGGALMIGAAAFALIVLFSEAQKAPRTSTKAEITSVLADHLMGLSVDPAPTRPPQALTRLRLLPPVRKVTVDLCLTGQRNGRDVAVSRIGLLYGQDQNYSEKQGDGSAFVMVEIAVPETVQSETMTAIMPTDASRMVQTAPTLTHGLSAVPTNDASFDARYTVYGNPAPVTAAFRAAFATIEAQTRCANHALSEVAPGSGLRPWVVLLPGEVIVLTPLCLFDGAFEPPPYWQPMDVDALIAAFAADLALLDAYLTAALSLPVGDLA